MVKYSIGIVTYNERFDKYFKPLINSIPSNIEIIVCINGNFNENFDLKYKKELLLFLANKDNVFPMFFTDFRSLSKLWNNCVINASNNHILLLNDDLVIKPNFFNNFNKSLENNELSFKINKSWSHVLINRNELNSLGWFDERFLSIGYEDTDIEKRYEIFYNKSFPNINIDGIINIVEKNMILRNQKLDSNYSKYSNFNESFFCKKYNVNNPRDKNINKKNIDNIQYPYEVFYWENKTKL